MLLRQLLESMTSHMVEARSQLRRGNSVLADTSQLLLIVSDGRCLGDRRQVKAAVRRAQDAQIFLVFVVLDNPNKEVDLARLCHFQYEILVHINCSIWFIGYRCLKASIKVR